MEITTAPRPPEIRLGPVAPIWFGQMNRVVDAPDSPVAFLTQSPFGLRNSLLNHVNIAGLGAMTLPKPDTGLWQSLEGPIDNLQTQCLAAKLIGRDTPFSATALMVVGNGKAIQKIFDPKATTFQKVAGVTGIASGTLGWARGMDPSAEWLTPLATTFKVADLGVNGLKLADDLRNPNRNIGKCFYSGVKIGLGVASLAVAQFPQLGSVKAGIDTVALILKISDNYVVAALEMSPALAGWPAGGPAPRA